jgi:hypothetical protein
MSTSVEGELKARLEELDRRLRDRRRELKELGRFADAHDVVVAVLRLRQAEILGRLNAELSRGVSWHLLKAEFALEFSGLFGTLLGWLERMDADVLKHGAGDRPAV